MALGMVLLEGPREAQFLMSAVPLYFSVAVPPPGSATAFRATNQKPLGTKISFQPTISAEIACVEK